jgi:hypothetical protein
MDKIQEFRLDKNATEGSITVQKNSHVLSTRLSKNTNEIIIDILVDLDNTEIVNKDFLIFTKNCSINDNMKANFIGTVVDEENKAYYIFEKIR